MGDWRGLVMRVGNKEGGKLRCDAMCLPGEREGRHIEGRHMMGFWRGRDRCTVWMCGRRRDICRLGYKEFEERYERRSWEREETRR